MSIKAGARHVAILGAGPIGLEAALAAADAGLPFTVYEAGPEVGRHVRAWGHVPLFTPWDLSVSPRMARHLAGAGLEVPAGAACPSGLELVDRVLVPLSRLPELAPHIRLGTRVEAVGRRGLLKHEEIAIAERRSRHFRLVVSRPPGDGARRAATGRAEAEPLESAAEPLEAASDLVEEVCAATAVLDCTGTYGQPNWMGDGGIPAPGERSLDARIDRHLPDLRSGSAQAVAWAGRSVLLVGAGASAQTAARGLAQLALRAPGTRVVWAVRRPAPTWGAVADDPLPGRAELVETSRALAAGSSPAVDVRLGTAVERLAASDGRIRAILARSTGTGAGAGSQAASGAGPAPGLGGGSTWADSGEVEVDRVLALTGYVGDDRLYRQLQVHECYATAAPIQLSAALLGSAGGDCLDQVGHGVDVLRNPEPDFFILGAKSYGRNNQFLLRVGWDQVTEVMADLA